MDEVFVAQLELDGPVTSEATAALRDQAATWFGSPRTRHLGTEVSVLGDGPPSGPRYLARARFVREPPRPHRGPPSSGLPPGSASSPRTASRQHRSGRPG